MVFLRCQANALFICPGYRSSLSFFFSSCRPRFSFLALACTPLTKSEEKEKETARSLLQVSSVQKALKFFASDNPDFRL